MLLARVIPRSAISASLVARRHFALEGSSAFKQREHAFEDEYFLRQTKQQLEKLRASKGADVAKAVEEHLKAEKSFLVTKQEQQTHVSDLLSQIDDLKSQVEKLKKGTK